MPALITTEGRIRILELFVNDMSHIGVGRPTWPDQLNPPNEDPDTVALGDTIGYAKITTRGWMVQDSVGPIIADGVRYSISMTPTTIAYVQAEIASGTAEGVSNGIGQIGVIGKDAETDPADAVWTPVENIINAGTLFRIQNLPVYIRPPNTLTRLLIIMPLLA